MNILSSQQISRENLLVLFLCNNVTAQFFSVSIIYMIKQRKGAIMNSITRKKKKAFVNSSDCVACGCCVKVCPIGAISIHLGITAKVDEQRCVGCGRCAKECPACVISVCEVEA